jgi:hypothetical protein
VLTWHSEVSEKFVVDSKCIVVLGGTPRVATRSFW